MKIVTGSWGCGQPKLCKLETGMLLRDGLNRVEAAATVVCAQWLLPPHQLPMTQVP